MNQIISSSASIADVINSLPEDQAGKVRLLMERGVKIPPQPRVLAELSQLVSRKVFDVRQLARTINQDPGITAMLFKSCTSAAYRQHQPFESVEEILQAVGVRQTYNLVQALTLVGAAQKPGKARAGYEAFWARSQGIAQLAMLVADDRVTVCNIFPDQAFLAGLFHDCGVALLMQRFSSYCKDMHLGEGGRWVNLADEDRRFSADHSVVGYLVARHWGLPDFICDAIRYHHDIEGMGLHAARSMVAIVLTATEIYSRLQRQENPDWLLVQPLALEELGIHADAFPEFVDVITERYCQGAS